MGSSAKKKREKRKDFQKPKLKVGKARPKAANQTDTNFRTKSIVLSQQSLNISAPTGQTQFAHHVSLLTSKADTQKRESLAYLTNYTATRPIGSALPISTGTLLGKLCPLILDGSGSVRVQLLKLLQVLPRDELRDHAAEILPYVRAGMTHLAIDIRLSSLNVLSWLVDVAGEELVSCAGGWYKTIDGLITTLGWHPQDGGKWSSNRPSFGKHGGDSKLITRSLNALAEFLQAGIGIEDRAHLEQSKYSSATTFPSWYTEQHMIPSKSNAYAYLNLFGMIRDDENQMLEDREERLRIFNDRFRKSIEDGLEQSKKEGGEVGRASAVVLKVIDERSQADA